MSRKWIDTLELYIRAACSSIWVETFEPYESALAIKEMADNNGWSFATWDIADGIKIFTKVNCFAPISRKIGVSVSQSDLTSVIKELRSCESDNDVPVILGIMNLHRFIENTSVIQSIINHTYTGRMRKLYIIGISPITSIPVELEKMFVVVDTDMPDREEISSIISQVAMESEIPKNNEEYEKILETARGMTSLEIEEAVSISVIKTKMVRSEEIWRIKSQAIKKSGILALADTSGYTLDELKGLDNVVDFCRKCLKKLCNGQTKPRGILCLGVPGTGKTHLARAIGNEYGLPTIEFSISRMMSSHYGKTELNVSRALKIVDSMSPCILLIDEIEKAFSGGRGTGEADSGATKRWIGTILSWMSDRKSDVFVVGTCNDCESLPPAIRRAERFDAIFFFDVPSREDKEKIWELYSEKYNVSLENLHMVDDSGWTGAEIKTCCRLASLLDTDISQSQNYVVSMDNSDNYILKIREWAEKVGCISASKRSKYSYEDTSIIGRKGEGKRGLKR
ncbi:MAG: AAA family ATPase [Candidatus Bilamarchaeaceae archaeon]